MSTRRFPLLLAALCLVIGSLYHRHRGWSSDWTSSPGEQPFPAAAVESGHTSDHDVPRRTGEGVTTTSGASVRRDLETSPPSDPGMSIAAMAESLRSAPDAGQKGEWADRIAAMGGREAVEQLVTLAAEQHDEEQTRAVLEAFKGLSDPQDILLLASAVTVSSDFRILEAATEMISRSATTEVVDYLAELSRQDPLQPTQHFAALWTIERIQNPEAIRGLAKLVQQAPEPDLTRAAAVALARLGGPLANSILTESAVDRLKDNPDFLELVQNARAGRTGDGDPEGDLAPWSLITEGPNP